MSHRVPPQRRKPETAQTARPAKRRRRRKGKVSMPDEPSKEEDEDDYDLDSFPDDDFIHHEDVNADTWCVLTRIFWKVLKPHERQAILDLVDESQAKESLIYVLAEALLKEDDEEFEKAAKALDTEDDDYTYNYHLKIRNFAKGRLTFREPKIFLKGKAIQRHWAHANSGARAVKGQAFTSVDAEEEAQAPLNASAEDTSTLLSPLQFPNDWINSGDLNANKEGNQPSFMDEWVRDLFSSGSFTNVSDLSESNPHLHMHMDMTDNSGVFEGFPPTAANPTPSSSLHFNDFNIDTPHTLSNSATPQLLQLDHGQPSPIIQGTPVPVSTTQPFLNPSVPPHVLLLHGNHDHQSSGGELPLPIPSSSTAPNQYQSSDQFDRQFHLSHIQTLSNPSNTRMGLPVIPYNVHSGDYNETPLMGGDEVGFAPASSGLAPGDQHDAIRKDMVSMTSVSHPTSESSRPVTRGSSAVLLPPPLQQESAPAPAPFLSGRGGGLERPRAATYRSLPDHRMIQDLSSERRMQLRVMFLNEHHADRYWDWIFPSDSPATSRPAGCPPADQGTSFIPPERCQPNRDTRGDIVEVEITPAHFFNCLMKAGRRALGNILSNQMAHGKVRAWRLRLHSEMGKINVLDIFLVRLATGTPAWVSAWDDEENVVRLRSSSVRKFGSEDVVDVAVAWIRRTAMTKEDIEDVKYTAIEMCVEGLGMVDVDDWMIRQLDGVLADGETLPLAQAMVQTCESRDEGGARQTMQQDVGFSVPAVIPAKRMHGGVDDDVDEGEDGGRMQGDKRVKDKGKGRAMAGDEERRSEGAEVGYGGCVQLPMGSEGGDGDPVRAGEALLIHWPSRPFRIGSKINWPSYFRELLTMNYEEAGYLTRYFLYSQPVNILFAHVQRRFQTRPNKYGLTVLEAIWEGRVVDGDLVDYFVAAFKNFYQLPFIDVVQPPRSLRFLSIKNRFYQGAVPHSELTRNQRQAIFQNAVLLRCIMEGISEDFYRVSETTDTKKRNFKDEYEVYTGNKIDPKNFKAEREVWDLNGFPIDSDVCKEAIFVDKIVDAFTVRRKKVRRNSHPKKKKLKFEMSALNDILVGYDIWTSTLAEINIEYGFARRRSGNATGRPRGPRPRSPTQTKGQKGRGDAGTGGGGEDDDEDEDDDDDEGEDDGEGGGGGS